MFQIITQIVKKGISLMVSNEGKREAKSEGCEAKSERQRLRRYLVLKKLSIIKRNNV